MSQPARNLTQPPPRPVTNLSTRQKWQQLESEDRGLQVQFAQLRTSATEFEEQASELLAQLKATDAPVDEFQAALEHQLDKLRAVDPELDRAEAERIRVRQESNAEARSQAQRWTQRLSECSQCMQQLAEQIAKVGQGPEAAPPAPPAPAMAPAATPPPIPKAVNDVEAPPVEEPTAVTVDERRTSQRVPVEASVSFNSDDNFYTGFSSDLSSGGLFVATIDLLEIGSQVDMQICLPDGRKVGVSGQVRWVREWNDNTPDLHPGMGVQFTEISDDVAAVVNEFLARREPMFYID